MALPSFDVQRIVKGDRDYPLSLSTLLRDDAPEYLSALGNVGLLTHKKLAFSCSVKCPASLILQTHDFAQSLRQTGVTVISGFHSPVEQEVLTVLLRGPSPVVIVVARGLGSRSVKKEYRRAIEAGRLLIVSPFEEKRRRATSQAAYFRNQLAAALADAVVVSYAAPGGRTEKFCQEVIAWHIPVYSFATDANAHLAEKGVLLKNQKELMASLSYGSV